VGWGFLTSTVFGLIAIAGLLRFLRTRTYRPFAIYRIVLAAIIVATVLARR
jgi:undecaprenyl pyrophosphate phosphatase UppP